MKNPFNPGSGMPPPFLAGRDAEMSEFAQALDSILDGRCENILLIGLRGTGKTVLVEEFSRMCEAKNIFPIKNLQFTTKHNKPEEFYAALKHSMSTATTSLSVTEKVTKKLKKFGSNIKPKSLGIPGTFYYEPSYTPDDMPFENHLEEYLTNNWPIFKKHKYRAVMLLFDEFHMLRHNEKKGFYVLADFIGTINELQKKKIPYCLVLSGLPRLPINLKEARSYTERMFKIITLDNLAREDAMLAISKPLDDSDCTFHDNLISTIVNDTGQYPYFIQFYCREIINRINKKNIKLDDYKPITNTIVSKLDHSFFNPRVAPLSDNQKDILYSMAKIQGNDIRFADIARAVKISKGTLGKDLGRLEEKGIIYKHKYGIYRFTMPLFKAYLLHSSDQH